MFQVDSDLVFENLEQTDLTNHENHHRIARDSTNREETLLESSPPVEEHWLSSTVNRIKRSINSLLSSQSNRSHVRSKRKSLRVPRQDSQGGQEEVEEEEEYEEDNEVGGYNDVSEILILYSQCNPRSAENNCYNLTSILILI